MLIVKVLDIIVAILLVIGGINWGLVGFFEYNLLTTIFGEATVITRLIYALVGLGALYEIFGLTVGSKELHHRWCEIAVKH